MLPLWAADASGRVTGAGAGAGMGGSVVDVVDVEVVLDEVVVPATRGRVVAVDRLVVGVVATDELDGGAVTWVVTVDTCAVREAMSSGEAAGADQSRGANISPMATAIKSPMITRTTARPIAAVCHVGRWGWMTTAAAARRRTCSASHRAPSGSTRSETAAGIRSTRWAGRGTACRGPGVPHPDLARRGPQQGREGQSALPSTEDEHIAGLSDPEAPRGGRHDAAGAGKGAAAQIDWRAAMDIDSMSRPNKRQGGDHR